MLRIFFKNVKFELLQLVFQSLSNPLYLRSYKVKPAWLTQSNLGKSEESLLNFYCWRKKQLLIQAEGQSNCIVAMRLTTAQWLGGSSESMMNRKNLSLSETGYKRSL